MHTVDVIAVCAVVLIAVLLLAIVARQRYMLRVGGAIPLAVRRHDARWSYGVGRYAGGQLRWYRAIGIGTRPTRVFDRANIALLSHRRPTSEETSSLPLTAVVVECREITSSGTVALVLAFGESAFTGFVSWLEASAPTV